jgi:hypothetical protein
VDGACVACIVTADCKGSGDLCIDHKCVPQTPCVTDKQCTTSGLICNKVSGFCVQCNDTSDCPNGQTCKANHCLPPPPPCGSSKDCTGGLVRDKTLRGCVQNEEWR